MRSPDALTRFLASICLDAGISRFPKFPMVWCRTTWNFETLIYETLLSSPLLPTPALPKHVHADERMYRFLAHRPPQWLRHSQFLRLWRTAAARGPDGPFPSESDQSVRHHRLSPPVCMQYWRKQGRERSERSLHPSTN